jgi:hypothetical protein
MTEKCWCFSDDCRLCVEEVWEGAVYLVGNHEQLADFAWHAGVSVKSIIYLPPNMSPSRSIPLIET